MYISYVHLACASCMCVSRHLVDHHSHEAAEGAEGRALLVRPHAQLQADVGSALVVVVAHAAWATDMLLEMLDGPAVVAEDGIRVPFDPLQQRARVADGTCVPDAVVT
jgi:hypothetical protein